MDKFELPEKLKEEIRARVLGEGLALKIVDTFLSTEFEGGRHARRVALLHEIENQG